VCGEPNVPSSLDVETLCVQLTSTTLVNKTVYQYVFDVEF